MAGGAEVFDLPDPLIWMTWAAAHTERIRLATGVLVLPQRNVVVTAKEVATLDHLSSGRVTLGVGVGWLAEEFDALGVPFKERGARMDEYIDILRELWAPSHDPEKSTVDGRFVRFKECIMRPRPAQGTVPIVIGGHSPAAARRAGRRGDGFFPGGGTMEELAEMFATVRTEAEATGRDPDSIELYCGGGRPGPKLDARIEQLAELGVSQVVVPAAPADELTGIGEDLVGRYGS
jgi:probable F420-dependent oxidoreductase